ncbi:LPS assembly lipoprotein LptE [Mariniblastus sp.]|jgi:hypothetical protein|nr:LPS assembly lipoprotein LptE [Mariniblastus sp.]MDB4756513.1 LPS assembly lipoprotein LptE [Mariniblastus sp.]
MKPISIPSLRLFVILVPVIAGWIGCASYQIGNRGMFRADVCTVHVPVFESDSFRIFIGERLTEAVVKEIESRTPFKVVQLANADSLLKGKIELEQKRVLIESTNDDARDLQVNLVVSVSWTDRYGRPLMSRQSITVNELTTFAPEGGQSLATAQKEVIGKIARDIVSQMEMPW